MLLFQRSARVPVLDAPAGKHLAEQPGGPACDAAGHAPARGSDSESPGGRLPSPGPGGLQSVGPGLLSGRSAGHAGSSDASPDQSTSVGGGQGHFTGNREENGTNVVFFFFLLSLLVQQI